MNLDRLKSKITEASQAYYSGNPIMEDDEFDALIKELKFLSPHSDLLTTIGSGYDPAKDTSGEKVPHKYRTVGSLDKINAETCEKYFEKHPGQYVITSKIDGGSIVCYYGSSGRFERAITRGDGKIGIDCTSKLRHIIPKRINLINTAVRGEITMSKENFDEFYPDAASPRNTALGIIGKDNPTDHELSLLSFVAYNVYGEDPDLPKTKTGILCWLNFNGFEESNHIFESKIIPKFLEHLEGELDPDYVADGLVLTEEENPEKEVAYKFIADTAETAVTKVKWETSRLGNVVPVVYFNPVKLSGARLEKCSGFNAKWILDNFIGIGTKVTVQRSGEVIPYIKSVLTKGLAELPYECSDCQSPLKWKGVHKYCPNPDCLKKIMSRLLNWISIIAPIDNLGENILVPFIVYMQWRTPQDIYAEIIEGWKIKVGNKEFFTDHAQKLLWEMFDKIYTQPVDPGKFFAAFGLPAVGMSTSRKIAEGIGLDKFFEGEFSWNDLKSLGGITEPVIRSLLQNLFSMKSVYLQIKTCPGFIMGEKRDDVVKIALTGKLSKPRKELVSEYAKLGFEIVDSVSKGVAYLITDNPNSGSSKNLAAQKLGVKVVSESEFLSIIKV